MTEASWHGLEDVGAMADAADMFDHADNSGCWPSNIRYEKAFTVGGQEVPLRALVADYLMHPSRCLSMVGGRFRHTTPEEWRAMCQTAIEAGGKPTGCFSLRGGSRVLATFEVSRTNGIVTNLLLADAFDGSMKLTVGFTTIRVVCANTLQAALYQDGRKFAKLGHTKSLGENLQAMNEAIAQSVSDGSTVAALYEEAKDRRLSRDEAMALLESLVPETTGAKTEKGRRAAKTRAENRRRDILAAARMPINAVNPGERTAASLWNGATWLVDRDLSGKAKKLKGGDRLDSMLFGSRAEDVSSIEQVMVGLLRPDGSTDYVPVDQAIAQGADPNQVGSAVLDSMLND
jgi:hypothetical protein